MSQQLRLTTGETVEEYSNFYGSHLVYVPHPDGIALGYMDYFDVNPELPKVPRCLWDKLISLFYDYALNHLEVHARIVYDSEWDDWKVIIPRQEVTGGSTSYEYTDSCDLETGIPLNYPTDLPSYDVMWQIHSHNTLQLKEPSGVDDWRTDPITRKRTPHELGTKQGYCVISNFNLPTGGYKCCFTIVSNDNKYSDNRRYFIPDNQVGKLVDGLIDGDNCYMFYSNYRTMVKTYITQYFAPLPKVTKVGKYVAPSYSWLPKAKTGKEEIWYDDWNTANSYTLGWGVEEEVTNLVEVFGLDAVVKVLKEKHGYV